MRKVDRSSVGLPPRLAEDLSDAIEQVRRGQDARPDIYRHRDVVIRLRQLYLGKCYLCERTLDDEGIVEHFIPWHPKYPERAYDWCNLHWSCFDCNQRKKGAPYRIPTRANQAAERTDLIDPSDLLPGEAISDLLTFDPLSAKATALRTNDLVVANTELFLNDLKPLHLRCVRRAELADTIVQADCKGIWETICLSTDIDISSWSTNERAQWLSAIQKADGIYERFLREGAPFGVSMRIAIHRMVGLTADEFRRMSDAYRNHRSLSLVRDIFGAAPSSATVCTPSG